nr:transposase [Salsuginibacillus kocurii]
MGSSIGHTSIEDQIDNMVKQFVKEKLELLMNEERNHSFETEHPELPYQKNGYYERTLDTKYGRISKLKVPRDRHNNYQTKVFKPYKRYEEWLGGTGKRNGLERSVT